MNSGNVVFHKQQSIKENLQLHCAIDFQKHDGWLDSSPDRVERASI
jgi:hypothetical protein